MTARPEDFELPTEVELQPPPSLETDIEDLEEIPTDSDITYDRYPTAISLVAMANIPEVQEEEEEETEVDGDDEHLDSGAATQPLHPVFSPVTKEDDFPVLTWPGRPLKRYRRRRRGSKRRESKPEVDKSKKELKRPKEPPVVLCQRCKRAEHAGECFVYHRTHIQWSNVDKPFSLSSKYWPKTYKVNRVLKNYGIEQPFRSGVYSGSVLSPNGKKYDLRGEDLKRDYSDNQPAHKTSQSSPKKKSSSKKSKSGRVAWSNKTKGLHPYSAENLRCISHNWPILENEPMPTAVSVS